MLKCSYQNFAQSLYIVILDLQKKSCAEGDQLHGGLGKYVRLNTRFHFTTT